MNRVILEEEWKDIQGYEGSYLISNLGRVISLYKYRNNGRSGYFQNTMVLKQTKTTTGYWKVELTKDGERKSIKVHRLVAKHFVPNPYKYEVVNHKDGNPLNNHFKNLEWCRQIDNVNHAIENSLKDVFDIDEKSLRYLYLEQNKTPVEIGSMFGLSRVPIDRKINEYGIKKETVTKFEINQDWLIKQLEAGKKNKDIAKEVGCDCSLISKYKSRLERGENIYAK